MALSTVIGRPIFTIYPSCSKALRPLLQGLIKPRIQTSNNISDNNCFYILWSRDGGLDNRPNAVYVPNCFVPLFQTEQVIKTEIFQKDSKVAVGTTKKTPSQKRSFSLEDFWFPSERKIKKKKNQTDKSNGKIKTADEEMDDEGKTEDEKATQNGTKTNEMTIEDEMMDEKNVQGERKMEDEMKDERKMEDEIKNEKKMEDENMENEENMEDQMKMRDEKVKDEKKMEDEKEIKHEMKIGDEKKKKGGKKLEDNPEMEMENKDKRKEYELK